MYTVTVNLDKLEEHNNLIETIKRVRREINHSDKLNILFRLIDRLETLDHGSD